MYEASIKRLEEAQRVAEANARQEKAYAREVDPLWAAVIEDYQKAIETLQAANGPVVGRERIELTNQQEVLP